MRAATSLHAPRIAADRGERVASFRDLHGAALAVRRLLEAGFAHDQVFVRPAGMTPLDGALVRPSRANARRVGRLAALSAGATLPVLLATGSAWWAAILTAVLVGLALGAALLVADRLHGTLVRRRRRRAAHVVQAGRFDVVATEQQQDAEHELASWWDPQAVPSALPGDRR